MIFSKMSALLWWCDFTYTICRVTLPTERVSWNVSIYILRVFYWLSRSPRSVWVEMIFQNHNLIMVYVTLPTERVSWNWGRKELHCYDNVTLPTERVSWNCFFTGTLKDCSSVTLPTERVSWNQLFDFATVWVKVTLPTERVSEDVGVPSYTK